jgi:RHH-type proline utilization regulon transcriptional repressor/proline dehydrogenase/delta 1-pyrroline-5-carboxylate dehydrogenase
MRQKIYHNKLLNMSYKAHAITEMGGKNAVIVTPNAELDETVSGIIQSAFSHAGQKCSALSRVIVHEAVKEKLIERLKEALTDIKVGAAYEFDTAINPVISQEDFMRLKREGAEAITEAKNYRGQVIVNRQNEENVGYALGPLLIELPFERAFDKESYAQKELFGPVLHIIGYREIDDAIRLFNSTEYALTGGVFSQSQNDIDYLISKIQCGNIYINRTITGARVAIEPFGGFKLSGTGPKAGGKHYIIALHQAQSIEQRKLEAPKNLAVDEGADYEYELLRPSKLEVISRLERMEKFTKQFISSFEFFYQGVGTGHKEVLKDFEKWISKNYVSYVQREHKNRTIPGQLSYNDYTMTAEHAILIAVNPRPEVKTLIQVLSGILSGTGMLVLCRNKETYLLWMSIKDALMASGFSKENFDVFLASTKKLKRIINAPKLSVIIYDGGINDLGSHVTSHLDAGDLDQRMKNILTINDPIKSSDFYHQLLNYVWVRSLAINTMRHGAPLDLEF